MPGEYATQWVLRVRLLWYALAIGAVFVAGHVVATPAFAAVRVAPVAFEPESGGDGDAAVVTYTLPVATRVEVVVGTARGSTVRTLVRGMRPAGTSTTWWDGRTDRGTIAAPGAYEIAVRPLGRATTKRARTATTTARVVIRPPRVAIRAVAVSRGTIGGTLAARSTTIGFTMTAPGTSTLAVVDSRGEVRRTIHSGRMTGGRHRTPWDGRDDRGRYVADGRYDIALVAVGDGMPSVTLRSPVRVDRTAPGVTVSANRARVTGSGVISLPLSIRATEAGRMVVRVGQRSTSFAVRRGTSQVTLRGSVFGIAAGSKSRRIDVVAALSDEAGNTRFSRFTTVIPARPARQPAQRRPTPPASTGTTPKAPETGNRPQLRWPLNDIVTSEFGPRWNSMHRGIDINANEGDPIMAAAPGIVTYAGEMDGYGQVVVIDHGGGMQTYYAHASRIDVVTGQSVNTGTVLAGAGCTGRCTGTHLHFEVRLDGAAVNPRAFLP